jgi:hypothetical protein
MDGFDDYPSWQKKTYTLRLSAEEQAQLLALRDDIASQTKGPVPIAFVLRLAVAELAAFRGVTI